jgi:hypothetical protein
MISPTDRRRARIIRDFSMTHGYYGVALQNVCIGIDM